MAFKGKCACYDKAAPDEPIFVLRAKDVLAPHVVLYWACEAMKQGTPLDKVAEAVGLVEEMRDWQAKHGAKVPD
jgi:hypothetical protein